MAKTVTYEQYDKVNPIHLDAASQIPEWQRRDKAGPNYAQMFDLSAEQLATHAFGIICLEQSQDTGIITPIGYNGATFEYPGKVFEVGGMIVNPEYRGQGYGTKIKSALVDALRQLYPEYRLITLANRYSLHVNKSCGFREATRTELPPEALDLCRTTCSSYQEAVVKGGRICCDTMMVHED